VIRTERSRSLRGHSNILHPASGYKADIRAILATTEMDLGGIETWVDRLGLARQWADVRAS
jgi:hypothetical protein